MVRDEFLLEHNNPVFPCICGHSITAHGTETDVYYNHYTDADGQEGYDQEPCPRAVCYECGPEDCYFVEMTNLEYLEWKSDKNKR